MKKKIIGILLVILLTTPILSVTANPAEENELEIGKITDYSGIGSLIPLSVIFDIEIKNTGDVDITDGNWSFRVKHPVFEILNFTLEKPLPIIKAGEEEIVSFQLVHWMGRFELTITANAPGTNMAKKTVQGIAFMCFVRIFD